MSGHHQRRRGIGCRHGAPSGWYTTQWPIHAHTPCRVRVCQTRRIISARQANRIDDTRLSACRTVVVYSCLHPTRCVPRECTAHRVIIACVRCSTVHGHDHHTPRYAARRRMIHDNATWPTFTPGRQPGVEPVGSARHHDVQVERIDGLVGDGQPSGGTPRQREQRGGIIGRVCVFVPLDMHDRRRIRDPVVPAHHERAQRRRITCHAAVAHDQHHAGGRGSAPVWSGSGKTGNQQRDDSQQQQPPIAGTSGTRDGAHHAIGEESRGGQQQLRRALHRQQMQRGNRERTSNRQTEHPRQGECNHRRS